MNTAQLTRIAGTLILSGAFSSAALAVDTYSESNTALADQSNWMARIPDAARLSDISIPGTHDSTTFTYRGTMWPYTFNGVVTQTMDYAEQFKAGIRFIDVRAKYSDTTGQAEHDGTTGRAFTIFHGAYYLDKNFYDILKEVNSFLDHHPTEAILMRLKWEGSADGVSDEAFVAAFNSYMTTIIPSTNTKANARHLWKGMSKNPTMGELKGKLVVLNDMTSCNGVSSEFAPLRYGCDQFSIQDKWDASVLATKWTAIKGAIDDVKAGGVQTKYINYLSASSILSPSSFAATENPWTYDYINARPNQRLGIVVMDFPGPDLIKSIIDHNAGYFSSGKFYMGQPTYGRIQNAWKRDQYLNTESGVLQSSFIVDGWTSARWNIIRDPQGWVRIQNGWHPNEYLNIENRASSNDPLVQSTPIDMAWISARWWLEPVANNTYRIRNAWKSNEYLNVENGFIQVTPIQSGAISSYWIMN